MEEKSGSHNFVDWIFDHKKETLSLLAVALFGRGHAGVSAEVLEQEEGALARGFARLTRDCEAPALKVPERLLDPLNAKIPEFRPRSGVYMPLPNQFGDVGPRFSVGSVSPPRALSIDFGQNNTGSFARSKVPHLKDANDISPYNGSVFGSHGHSVRSTDVFHSHSAHKAPWQF